MISSMHDEHDQFTTSVIAYALKSAVRSRTLSAYYDMSDTDAARLKTLFSATTLNNHLLLLVLAILTQSRSVLSTARETQ